MIAFPSRLLEEKEGVSKAWRTLAMPSGDSLVVGLKLYTRVLSCRASFCVHMCAGMCMHAHTCTHTVLFRAGCGMVEALGALAKRKLGLDS